MKKSSSSIHSYPYDSSDSQHPKPIKQFVTVTDARCLFTKETCEQSCLTSVEPLGKVEVEREHPALKYTLETVSLDGLPFFINNFESNILVRRASVEAQNNKFWRVSL
mgnify:CR=1 FL=1